MTLAHERRGGGEPLVLVHGIGSQWQMWAPVLDAVAATRDVVAVDLPGFGDSPPLPGRPTPEALAGAVAELLDALGLETAHVAGNSLGGGVALELGRTGRARSVTCLSPVGFWIPREQTYSNGVLRASAHAARALAPVAPAVLGTPVGQTLGFWHLVSRPWRMRPAEAVGALRNLAGSPGFEATLDAMQGWRLRDGDAIACPVTIAWAQWDMVLIPRQADRARRALPRARHGVLAGCGHVPTWDDPAQVARVLREGSGAAGRVAARVGATPPASENRD
ncbi:MAG TPA: alpha/beta fold hydrolase [Solirubrobacteraceae bacterium]|nr:alpha/beta fold hydrolase [Solirubrobacteraceae bacterium]